MGNVITRFKPPPTGTAEYGSYSAATQTTGSTTVDVTPPTGIADGDLLVAYVLLETPQSSVTCTGFTQIDSVGDSLHEARSFYKIASSESGDYTWNWSTETSGVVIHMIRVVKGSGTWTAPTTIGYHLAAFDSSTGVATGNIIVPDNSVLLVGFSNDDGSNDITTPPSGMTQTVLTSVGTFRGTSYFQEYATGTTTSKQLIWNGSDPNAALGVVCHAE